MPKRPGSQGVPPKRRGEPWGACETAWTLRPGDRAAWRVGCESAGCPSAAKRNLTVAAEILSSVVRAMEARRTVSRWDRNPRSGIKASDLIGVRIRVIRVSTPPQNGTNPRNSFIYFNLFLSLCSTDVFVPGSLIQRLPERDSTQRSCPGSLFAAAFSNRLNKNQNKIKNDLNFIDTIFTIIEAWPNNTPGLNCSRTRTWRS
jgi:hypothetical protein